MTKVYIDLDGVLANFEARAVEIATGAGINLAEGSLRDLDKEDRKRLWIGISKYNKEVKNFFENLDMMEDARELLDFCFETFDEVEILTATGLTPKDAGEQKRRWVKKNVRENVIVNTVQRSSEKGSICSNPEHFLIDDTPKAIKSWEDAGGIGILHTSAKSSIEMIKKALR